MNGDPNRLLTVALCVGSAFLTLTPFCDAVSTSAQATQQSSGASRRIGAVKAINGMTIALTPDSGPDITVAVQPATRIIRIAPGEKDLKSAASIQLQDIQIGDRLLVAGKASDANQSLVASSIVVMKRSDLESRREQDLQDWQKHGVDGLAKAVDVAAGTVTIAVRGKDLIIHISNGTLIRRYA